MSSIALINIFKHLYIQILNLIFLSYLFLFDKIRQLLKDYEILNLQNIVYGLYRRDPK